MLYSRKFSVSHLSVDKLQAVNNAAKRDVKLFHDFFNVAREKNRFQEVLQVVEKNGQKNAIPISEN